MEQINAVVVAKKDLVSGIFRLTLHAPAVAAECRPGQFVHLRCGSNQSYILRRPFSIHQVVGSETIEILVKVVGQGTSWLSALRPKSQIDMLGPLGRGFQLDLEINRAMIVAGGMGVAPLVFLAQELAAKKVKVYSVLGAAGRGQLLDFMDLKRLTRKIAVATDDGSQGHKGPVTEILAKEIDEAQPEMIFACGPQAMMKKVAGIAARFEVPCQVSLEAVMACGVGACLGCAVKSPGGYLKVCDDGPVFYTEELEW